MRKILIMGLPGAGKTTLARTLAPLLNGVIFNADEVRAQINRDLGFSPEDRVEHARRMGWMCDRVVEAGGIAIADFICPTPQTRAAFGPAFHRVGGSHPGGPVRGHQSPVRRPGDFGHPRLPRGQRAVLGRTHPRQAASRPSTRKGLRRFSLAGTSRSMTAIGA